jgi:hypothetical protein
MKITIDRNTADLDFLTTPDASSPRLSLFGQVDCLHTDSHSIWKPDLLQIERFLDQKGANEICKNITSIEGQYLLILKKGAKIYLFCDRFCTHPYYYRVSSTQIEVFDRILAVEDHLTVNQSIAIVFLLFGYVPGRQTLFQDISRLMPGECLVFDTTTRDFHINLSCVYPKISLDANADDDQVTEKFHSLFLEALENRISQFHADETFLLPLSGGLDSRYLLGTALELVSPSRIVAMTFGQQGSYDFEFGNLVAKTAGVRHLSYPLTPEDYHAGNLRSNCLDTDGQISFTTEAPLEIYRSLAEYGKNILSGHPGDFLMGEFAGLGLSSSRAAIPFLFPANIGINDRLTRFLDTKIMQATFFYSDGFDYPLNPFEMWLGINRLTKYTAYCVYKYRDFFNYICPYNDYRFIDYMINLPRRLRKDRRLHFLWLRKHFTSLAELPCNTFWGLPVSASTPRIFLAHQWDRILYYGLGINRRVNKIDFSRYQKQVLESPISTYHVFASLPHDFTRLLNHPRYYLVHYCLKCLEVLYTDFNVNFM